MSCKIVETDDDCKIVETDDDCKIVETDDDCKIVETLIRNVNPFRGVHCFVFYYEQ